MINRQISEIAHEISKTWKNVNYAAMPYLAAMHSLDSPDSNYGYDSGKSIVLYFLSNSTSWRGEDARRIKKELRDLIK